MLFWQPSISIIRNDKIILIISGRIFKGFGPSTQMHRKKKSSSMSLQLLSIEQRISLFTMHKNAESSYNKKTLLYLIYDSK
jgi:hypothetical protein